MTATAAEPVTATIALNPVALEVLRMGLDNIVEEMATVLIRTSGSPVLTEAMDFSCCLLDAEGQILSYPGYVLLHVAPARMSVRAILERYGDRIARGDAFLCNDPHTTGNMHFQDWGVVTPVFHGDKLVAFAWSEAHVLDTGGVAVGGFALGVPDCFGEAVRIPPIRIVEDGELLPDVEALIMQNVRLPVLVGNDLRSLIAAGRVARDRLGQLIDRRGAEAFARSCDAILALSERLTRKRIADIPDGIHEATDWQEHDGKRDALFRLAGKLEIDGDELRIHFTGDPQTDGPINSHPGSTYGSIWAALMQMLCWDIPFNEGCLRPVQVTADKGTIASSLPPAPVSSAHLDAGVKVTKLTVELLSCAYGASSDPLLLARRAGQFHDSWQVAVWTGRDQHGDLTVWLNMDGGGAGGGAQTINDGLDGSALMCQANNSLPDVELNEMMYPALFLYRRLWANSGGPGRFRGGMGVEAAWIPWGTERLDGMLSSACMQVPARGTAGGLPGAGSSFRLGHGIDVPSAWFARGAMPTPDELVARSEPQPAKRAGVTCGPHDVFVYRNGGGGGFGDPLDRPIELVARDFRAGRVTARHATAAYGVVVAGDSTVDAEATDALRAKRRAQRAAGGERVSDLSARFAELEMHVVERHERRMLLVERPLDASGVEWEVTTLAES